MSEIKRAAWLGKGPNGVKFIAPEEEAPVWRGPDGYSISPVVEVQPVLDALKQSLLEPFPGYLEIIVKLIDQLEKAVQP